MTPTITTSGKPAFTGTTVDTPFDPSQFHEVALLNPERNEVSYALHTDLGSLTVLRRLLDYGFLDVESGYRNMAGKFWLASGDCDVRKSGAKTLGEAIAWVQLHSNTCVRS